MVDTTQNVKWGYYIESAYAAGSGTTEFEQADLTSASGMDYPSDSFTLPLTQYEREDKEPASGFDAKKRTIYVKGYKYADSSFPMYIQTNTWLDIAINDKSFSLYYNTPKLGTRTAFGCKIKTYTLEANGSDFPKQTIELVYYNVKSQSALASEPTPDITHPLTHKDITITVDGNAYKPKSLTFKIEKNVIEDFVSGQYERYKPEVIDEAVSVELETFDDASSLLDDLDSTTITDHTIVIGVGTLATITLNGMNVLEVNTNEVPGQRDVFSYKATLKGGLNCSVSLS